MTFDELRTWREAMFTKQPSISRENRRRWKAERRSRHVRSFASMWHDSLRATRAVSAISCFRVIYSVDRSHSFNGLRSFINANSHNKRMSSSVASSSQVFARKLNSFLRNDLGSIECTIEMSPFWNPVVPFSRASNPATLSSMRTLKS